MEHQKQPVRLKDLKHAATPPTVLGWWSKACWIVFVVGVLLVLGTLGAMALLSKEKLSGAPALKLGFLTLLFLAFGFAAVNTYAAANRFDRREKDLRRWLREHLRIPPGPDGLIREESEPEYGGLRVSGGQEWKGAPGFPGISQWFVFSMGAYVPNPFRDAMERASLRCGLKEYLDLIHDEVKAARTRAATMAAALGGLFVAALQVYGKVFT